MKIRGIVTNLLVAVVAVLFSVGIAEMAVRIMAPQRPGMSHQDRYGLALHYPGLVQVFSEFGDHEVSFNAVGMRDREHSEAKLPGVFRVLVLGDSFMEAIQVPFEESLPSLLEKGIADLVGGPAEVINAGVSGWGTDDQLRYLTEYGFDYEPDLIVVAMTLHNDISDNLRQSWHTLADGKLVARDVRPIPPIEYGMLRLKAFLASRLQLVQLYRKVRHRDEMRATATDLDSHVASLFQDPPPRRIAHGFDLTTALLEQVKAASDRHGADLVVVLLPILHQLSDSSWADFTRSVSNPHSMTIGQPQQVVSAAAEGLQVDVIDLLPAFREWTAGDHAPLYFGWDGHWTTVGHHLASEVVLGRLDEIIP